MRPATNRFPSAAGGKGFRPLADFIHGLGLKFGMHVMRGIPRQAVHANTPILGSEARARDIAHPSSICIWNTDMYGVEPSRAGAQAYYRSLFELYASWGVDYVKVDDILYSYYEAEIELIRDAIDNCGREMVLSLSCGPTSLERAEHLKKHANMWRITGDFWDSWDGLAGHFEACDQWSTHVGPGHWPDADMLPVGHIAVRSVERSGGDRWTRLTRDEQRTILTLWCIFRSPLMLGCELRDADEWTLSLLTNPEVLRLLESSHSGRQLSRDGWYNRHVVWVAEDEDGSSYLALFNVGMTESRMEVPLQKMGLNGAFLARDVWQRSDLGRVTRSVAASVPAHGAMLFKLTPQRPS